MSGNFIYRTTEGAPLKLWTRGVVIEPAAIAQLEALAKMPFIHRHIAVMPDAHGGIGSCVGTVLATKGAIIPAAVGVDIGCGMSAARTPLYRCDLPDFRELREAIERAIPHGRTHNGGVGDRGAWGNVPGHIAGNDDFKRLTGYIEPILEKHPRLKKAAERMASQMGTLGTGNHFVEVCVDEYDRVWIMLHSGSRGIGSAIGTYFTKAAKQKMNEWFITLPSDDLAYLPQCDELFKDYIISVTFAQDYAKLNRKFMMQAALDVVGLSCFYGSTLADNSEVIDCHHNFVAYEYHNGQHVWITRKGATRAWESDQCIIPGSMGAKSYICRGKSNAESYNSCSHGAGRAMSRTTARKIFTLEHHISATEDVECRKDEGIIDETPLAYKPIDDVMEAQSDLVTIEHTLKQVICVKG